MTPKELEDEVEAAGAEVTEAPKEKVIESKELVLVLNHHFWIDHYFLKFSVLMKMMLSHQFLQCFVEAAFLRRGTFALVCLALRC